MATEMNNPQYRILSAEVMDAWRLIPSTIATDCMNRTQSMFASIKPMTAGAKVCGQARTVSIMVGDAGPISVQIDRVRPGEVIVIDAGGVEDIAVWGGMMACAAAHRGVGGGVVDGAVRDVGEMREFGFNMFARSAVPRGPHGGFGGVVDSRISAGGVPVAPGDIVLGDEDGVVVVPLDRADELLAACQQHLLFEKQCFAEIKGGMTLMELTAKHFKH